MVWAWLGIVILLVAPAAILRRAGARRRWFFLGILSWLLALAIKIPAVLALYTADGAPRFLPVAVAVIHGLLSAAAELGMAALVLRRARLSLPDVLAFGAAIGSFEVAWVLWEGTLELVDRGELTRANVLALASGPLLIERAVTLVSHTASRVLVYIALVRRWVFPAALAVGLFALCDGVAAYGGIAGWRWQDLWVRAGFNLFLVAVAALEVLAAWRFGRAVPWLQGRVEV